MSVLVTGGAGFIGSFTVRKLVERGEEVVLTIHRSSPVTLEARGPYENVLNKVKTAKGDIADMSFVLETVKKYDVKRIIHTVAVMSEILSVDPTKASEVNIRADMNILEVARMLGIERVVYTSSARVYGAPLHPLEPTKEDQPVSFDWMQGQQNAYAASKIFTEMVGLDYQKMYGVDFLALRILGPYGPGRVRGPTFYPIREIIENAAKGKSVRVEKGGDFKRDYNYVEDTAEACVLACFADKLRNRIFNVSSGETHTLLEVRDIVLKLIPDAAITIGRGAPAKPLPVPATLDISRARKELGWKPRHSLEAGIKKYVTWLRNKRED